MTKSKKIFSSTTATKCIAVKRNFRIKISTIKISKMNQLHNKDPIKKPIKVNFIHKLVLIISYYQKLFNILFINAKQKTRIYEK